MLRSGGKKGSQKDPPASPYDRAITAMITGVKNCTPRARLNAEPIAVPLMRVGNSSAKRGPYPPKHARAETDKEHEEKDDLGCCGNHVPEECDHRQPNCHHTE